MENKALVYRAVFKASGLMLSLVALEDLSNDVQCTLIQQISHKEGLLMPMDVSKPGGWFFRVVANKTTDILRKRTGPNLDWSLPFDERIHREDQPEARTVELEQARLLDLQSLRRRLQGMLQALPPIYGLAWILLNLPELLQREDIERAVQVSNWAPPEHVIGLSRSLEDTWSLLRAWRARQGRSPKSSTSRRELSWILRSTDQTDPTTWRSRQPDELSKARDLLRKWEAHANKKLLEVSR